MFESPLLSGESCFEKMGLWIGFTTNIFILQWENGNNHGMMGYEWLYPIDLVWIYLV